MQKLDLPEHGGPISAVTVLGTKAGRAFDNVLTARPFNNKSIIKK